MKIYEVTVIGQKELNSSIMFETDAVEFFEKSGIEFWEAAQNLIPEFVVKEINSKKIESKQGEYHGYCTRV